MWGLRAGGLAEEGVEEAAGGTEKFGMLVDTLNEEDCEPSMTGLFGRGPGVLLFGEKKDDAILDMSVLPALIAPELNPKALFAPPSGALWIPGLETGFDCVNDDCDGGRPGVPDVCNSQSVGSRGTGTGGGGGDATRPKGLLTPPVRCVLTA